MKIAIIGNNGSGKSTFALKLSKYLNIPLYHLDHYYWKPGWQKPSRLDFQQKHNQLCDKSLWIIDGMATRYLEYRIQKADVVVFLDMPVWRCLFRAFKRAYQNIGLSYFGNASGCPMRMPSMKFLKVLMQFKNSSRPIVIHLLKKYNNKKIFIIDNMAELDCVIKELCDNYKDNV